MTLVGAFVGGALVPKLGLTRMLLVGAVLVVSTNLLFAWLAYQPPRVLYLALVISADNLSAGIATVAFIAYLSALTNIRFSATQYALFSSLMLLFPKFVAGGSGWLVDQIDYPAFFVVTAIMGVPVIFLILWLRRIAGDPVVVVTKAPSDIGAG
jgi:PAT family beta-lactamase induction signal transducer AmpG